MQMAGQAVALDMVPRINKVAGHNLHLLHTEGLRGGSSREEVAWVAVVVKEILAKADLQITADQMVDRMVGFPEACQARAAGKNHTWVAGQLVKTAWVGTGHQARTERGWVASQAVILPARRAASIRAAAAAVAHPNKLKMVACRAAPRKEEGEGEECRADRHRRACEDHHLRDSKAA